MNRWGSPLLDGWLDNTEMPPKTQEVIRQQPKRFRPKGAHKNCWFSAHSQIKKILVADTTQKRHFHSKSNTKKKKKIIKTTGSSGCTFDSWAATLDSHTHIGYRMARSGRKLVATGTDQPTDRPAVSKREIKWMKNLQQPTICVESPRRSSGSRVRRNRWDDGGRAAALPTWLYSWLCPALGKSEIKKKKMK